MLISVNKIKPNPNNPRLIKGNKFKQLVQSIKDFPEMLKLRPIVVNKEMTILGGNMRLKACVEAGLKKVPISIAEQLTSEQEKEFIIKDNSNFGQWDFDVLANEWDTKGLNEWGIDVWQPEEAVDYSVLDNLDLGTTLQDKAAGAKRAIQIEFESEEYNEAYELISYFRNKGISVGGMLLEKLRSEK
jgi:hypothetical protein